MPVHSLFKLFSGSRPVSLFLRQPSSFHFLLSGYTYDFIHNQCYDIFCLGAVYLRAIFFVV